MFLFTTEFNIKYSMKHGFMQCKHYFGIPESSFQKDPSVKMNILLKIELAHWGGVHLIVSLIILVTMIMIWYEKMLVKFGKLFKKKIYSSVIRLKTKHDFRNLIYNKNFFNFKIQHLLFKCHANLLTCIKTCIKLNYIIIFAI